MANSPLPRNPSSGNMARNASLAATALAAPARIWSLLFMRRGDPSPIPVFQRRLYGSHRRPDLLLAGGTIANYHAEHGIEIPKTFVILEDIVQHTLSNMHSIQKSILFWQSIALRTDSQKVYFMIFQRGPRAFVETTCQMLAKLRCNGSPVQDLLASESYMVSTKLDILTRMQRCLAYFLAEVYDEVEKCRGLLIRRSEKSLHRLFVALNNIFFKLEAALRNAVGEWGAILSNHDDDSFKHLFQRLPEADVQSSAAISFIYDNLQKLLSSHVKPRKMTVCWLPYTFGALGLSAFSLWLLCHSSLMGSSDIDNLIHGAKELLVGYWDKNVRKPVRSIRYLYKTLQQSKGVTGKQEIQLTEDPLSKCGSILVFLHERFEKEPTHPNQTISNEELACLMLNQTQKLVLDLKEAMLEFDQLLRIQQIALVFVRWLLLPVLLVPAWVVHGQFTERRGSSGQHKRRLLLFGVEENLQEFQQCMANGMEEEAHCKFGLFLLSLYRFYRGIESHLKGTGEWVIMKEFIFNLADPQIRMTDKWATLSYLRDYI
uniref:Uncharacterized protein n=1 Tax=Oryza punctata TaxID=4537 RepID=A0A0E0KER9_ORYPU